MELEKFLDLVERALRSLPEELQEKMDNIEILVAENPSPGQLRRVRVSRQSTLLGLYEGVPRTNRGLGYNLTLPDKITIFQKPIEAQCRSEAEIVSTVERVVIHEIAHHFGISDARLRELGKY